MIVLSLFDGMGCGWIALKELGIPVEKAYASEVDRFAITQTKLNFPDVIQLGDVNNWQSWDIHWSSIDLVLAGSPCQGFSFAGKGLAFDDPRSKLFFVFVDILNNCRDFNPDVKFLLENVDMKKEYLRIISEYVGLFPTKINSTLVSAQNRERWYWTNIRTKKSGLFDEIHTDIPQPKDRKIFLRDILQPESDIDKKYYLSRTALSRVSRKIGFIPKIEPEKTGTLNAKNNSGQLCLDAGTTLIKCDRKGIPKADQNKASALTVGRHGNGDHSDMDVLLCVDLNTASGTSKTRRGGVTKDKAGTLTHDCAFGVVLSEPTHKHGEERIYDEGKAPTIQARYGTGGDNVPYVNNLRRLTPIECSRLQTIPSWYKWDVSDSQIYRMLGNGWTVEVIKHILSFISE